MDKKFRVLLVDDEAMNLKILSADLEDNGYDVVQALDGQIAYDILKNDKNFDIILLDRMMPNINGIQMLELLKNDEEIQNIPVIMQTAAASYNQVQEGFDSGVYYYLTKPYEVNVMLAIIRSAIRHSKKFKQILDKTHDICQTYNLIKFGSFTFRTLNEARSLAQLVSYFCYEPGEAVVGIAELMINAVEHGNLEIELKEKTRLLLTNEWNNEIERRLQKELYKNREAKLTFEKKEGLIEITIEDQGNGFDWKPFLEMSLERTELPNGRGIKIARMTSFHSIEYVGKGNKVICRIMPRKNNPS